MKIVKTILLILWGILTVCIFLLALIQRQGALKSESKVLEMQLEKERVFLDYRGKIQEEYYRNLELLKRNPLNKRTIDSIYKSSNFLKTMTSEKIEFEIKDNPKKFMTNKKYK
jgi:hypothetical protein